ncbi:CoA transferase [Dermatophilaceae bacterium Soc4.6]
MPLSSSAAAVAALAQAAVGNLEPLAPVGGGTTALDSQLRVEDLALGAVAFCASEAARFIGHELPVDPGRVGACFRSPSHVALDGVGFAGFDPLSGFFEAADGWVRTHANYPWHRQRLAQLLGLTEAPSRDDVAAAVRERSAHEIESGANAAGAIAVQVRTPAEFAAVPGMAGAPLLRYLPGPPAAHDARDPSRPVRVLDLTRVIAGPVATKTLASLGLDVLRLDPPQLPEMEMAHLDSAAGKHSTVVDLRLNAKLVRDLVDRADVVVTGYRPGALAAFGLDTPELLERRPDLVVAVISAWPGSSAWSHRRGFDSIVQAASGIAHLERRPDGTPGALRAQALDHGAGYLLAGGILHALAAGEGARVGVSLTGPAMALLHLGTGVPSPEAVIPDSDAAHLETVDCAGRRLTRVRSMWELDGVDAHAEPLGASMPMFRRAVVAS